MREILGCEARGNHQGRQADDVVRTVSNPGRITRIRHAGRQTTGRASLALDRAQQGRTGIRADARTIKSRQDRLAIKRLQEGVRACRDFHGKRSFLKNRISSFDNPKCPAFQRVKPPAPPLLEFSGLTGQTLRPQRRVNPRIGPARSRLARPGYDLRPAIVASTISGNQMAKSDQ
jgi:hypothetical protein